MKKILKYILVAFSIILSGNAVSQTFTHGQLDVGNECDWPFNSIATNPVDGKQYAFFRIGSEASAVYSIKRHDGGTTWTTMSTFSPSDIPSPFDGASDHVEIAIGANGVFHLVFSGQEIAACCGQERGVWYGTSSNAVNWSFTKIETFSDPSGFKNTSSPMIKIGSDNNPRIAFEFTDVNIWTYSIRYFEFNGTSWSSGEYAFSQTGANNEINGFSFDLDSNDDAHIAMQKETNNSGHDAGLWYTTNSSGSWATPTELVAAVADVGDPPCYDTQGSGASIAIDAADKVHILHTDFNGKVKYVNNTSGSFVSSTLNSNLDGYFPHAAFKITPAGHKFLVYIGSSGLEFAYLLNGGSGNWTTGLVTAIDFNSANFYSGNLSDNGNVTFLYDLKASGSCGPSIPRNLKYSTATITLPSSPEINLKGNGQSITDGDGSPSSGDHTEFGNQEITFGTVVRTFTIENTGAGTLNLNASNPRVTLTGHTSDFTVSTQPSTATVAASGNTTFQVTFNPTTSNLREATVSIASDDSDENPYTFDIQGTGVYNDIDGDGFSTAVDCNDNNNAIFPGAAEVYDGVDNNCALGIDEGFAVEINLTGNGQNISDGASSPTTSNHTDFGSQNVSLGTVIRTFTIQNSGNAPLELNASNPRVILSGHTSDFTVSSQPSSATVAAAGSTTFQITFDPTTTGLREATVSIVNDDTDENPYTFDIQGSGTITPPDIPTITSLPNLVCDGNAAILTISGDKNDATEWKVYTGSCGGTFVGSPFISTIIVTPTPPSTTYFIRGEGGGVTPGSCGSITVNTTAREDANFSYPAASYFTTDANPSPTITGLAGGSFSAAGGLSINSSTGVINLASSTPATYTVTYNTTGICNGDEDRIVTIFGVPEINIRGNGNSIVDGDVTPSASDHTNFGSVNFSSGSVLRTFTIENTGTGVLNLSGNPRVSVSGANAADFTVSSQPTATVAASGSTTFQISFDPSAAGVRNATVTIANDDANEIIYDFAIRGTGLYPEINLKGNGNSIVDGDVTPLAQTIQILGRKM